MSWRNGPSRLWGLLASSLTALGLTLALFTPTLANAATVEVSKPDASLTASWWQKFVAISGSNALDRCDVGTGKILFLAGTTGQPVPPRTCTTDKAKTFLVPLINVECSIVGGDAATVAELPGCAKGFADDFTDLKLVIDGQQIGNLNKLRVQAASTFTPVPGNVFIPNLTKPTESEFASDGYWALIKLNPGEHTLTFGGAYVPVPNEPPAFATEVTYHLNIKK